MGVRKRRVTPAILYRILLKGTALANGRYMRSLPEAVEEPFIDYFPIFFLPGGDGYYPCPLNLTNMHRIQRLFDGPFSLAAMMLQGEQRRESNCCKHRQGSNSSRQTQIYTMMIPKGKKSIVGQLPTLSSIVQPRFAKKLYVYFISPSPFTLFFFFFSLRTSSYDHDNQTRRMAYTLTS